jgi:hypothetical protein
MIRNYASYSSILRRISYFSPRRVVAFAAFNNRFRNDGARDSLQHEVRNEEGCGAINPCCSGVACGCGHSRGAAAGKSPADRVSGNGLFFFFLLPPRSTLRHSGKGCGISVISRGKTFRLNLVTLRESWTASQTLWPNLCSLKSMCLSAEL